MLAGARPPLGASDNVCLRHCPERHLHREADSPPSIPHPFRSASVASTSTVFPARNTFNFTLSPGLPLESSSVRSIRLVISRSFQRVITSLSFKPAAAAGVLGVAPLISQPLTLSSPP